MFDKLSERLFEAQNECCFSWITQDGSPASTIVNYLWEADSLWMTAQAGCVRVKALSRDNRASLVVSGTGCAVGEARCVAMRGICVIHRDSTTRDWFFPLFAKRVLPSSQTGVEMMDASMNNAANLVLEFMPKKVTPYDAQQMMRMAGKA